MKRIWKALTVITCIVVIAVAASAIASAAGVIATGTDWTFDSDHVLTITGGTNVNPTAVTPTDITKVVISSADVTLASGAFGTATDIEFVGNNFQWAEVTSDTYTNVTCKGGTVTLESNSSDAVLVSYTDIKVFKIPAGKTESDIAGYFKSYDGCKFEASGNKSGDTITIKSATGKEKIKMTLIVSGDIDKDGNVDKDDVNALIGRLSELGGTALTGDAFMAADIDNDFDNDVDDLFALAGKIGTDTDQKYIIDKTASGEKAYILNIQTGEYVNYVMFAVNCTNSAGVSVTGGCNPKTVSTSANKIVIWVNVQGKDDVNVTVEFGSAQSSFSVSELKAITASGKILAGTAVTAPAAPSVTTFSANSITISSENGYEYGCSTSNTSCSNYKKATGSTLTFDGLAASTTYYIFYKDSAGKVVNPTSSISATTADGTPKPSAPSVSERGTRTLTLIRLVQGQSYAVTTSATAPVASSSEWKSFGSSTTTVVSGLTPNTSYYIHYKGTGTTVEYITANTDSELGGPEVTDFDESSITVRVESFSKVYISTSSAIPAKDASGWQSVSGNSHKFTGRTSGTIYYIFGQTSAGDVSAYTIAVTKPNISSSNYTVDHQSITVPYNENWKYALVSDTFSGEPINYISPTTSAQSSYSGSIKRDSSKVVISGLEGDTSYTLYVKVYNGDTSLSDAYELSFKTTRLVSILDAGKTSSTISVKYETNIIYKIGNSDWTDAYGYNLPTASNPAALGGGIEFYYDNSINPTVITFSGLEQNTSYTIKAKYYTDPDSNAISKPIATRECSHIFGDKIYGADGLTYTRTCSRCGYVQTGKDSLADCQHLHTETKTVPSTCAAQGYTVNVCSVCGKEISQRQLLPIVSHVYDHDCDDTCNLCGAKRQITGHIFIDFTKPSSCSEKGYTVKKCARCGYEDILSKVELPMLEHTPGEWEVMHEPTDTADGFKVKKCTECGKILETADISRITRTENQNGTITYKLSSGGDSIALSEIASKAVGESGDVKITFVNESVEIQFDRTMTAALIADGATLTLKKVNAASASGDLTKAGFIGDGFTVYEISLENAVFVGKNGKATITISYECSDGLSASVYYVAPDGTKTRMTAPKGKTVYDAATKTITFETSHFSTYVVAEEIGVPAKPKSNGAIIAIIAVAAVVIATAGTFGYIVFISKRTKKKGFKF